MLHSSPERNPLLAERFEGKESRRLPGNVVKRHGNRRDRNSGRLSSARHYLLMCFSSHFGSPESTIKTRSPPNRIAVASPALKVRRFGDWAQHRIILSGSQPNPDHHWLWQAGDSLLCITMCCGFRTENRVKRMTLT